MKISFIIPCYNSEFTIENVIKDIVITVKDNNVYEIICVNDCSSDNVYDKLKDIAKVNNNVKVINFSKNFGQHNALLCGMRHITGDIIVCLDDDGQTDPKQCYKLINALDENTDVVYAKYDKKKHSLCRNIGTFINKKMCEWLCDMPISIVSNSYFACKKFVINEICRYGNPYTFLGGLIFRTTKNIKNVEIEHFERKEGKSGYTLIKLFSLWLNGFTAFSIKPLRIASFIGFFLAIIGFIYGIIVIVGKFINPLRPVGYSSLMCILLFIGGIIMIILGLIGEYVGRIYISINNSPQYVIKDKINFDE